MSEPVIVARADHPISRSSIDPDALKVLTRLHDADYTAYLVGGSVRDLLLGRRPKDFDIGTSAHPYQIKKLFRNCWIIGRRFRLAHVQVRRQGDRGGDLPTAACRPAGRAARRRARAGAATATGEPCATSTSRDLQIHRDNTFGTPEEDAFRRDFTVNALFYDIATFSIIDYVGGLQDIRDRVIRSIGDPDERFQEDPVRMLRAVVLAARLGFALDPPVVEAIAAQRHLMAQASPARLLEEYYKVLRSGAAERTFQDAGAISAARADHAGIAGARRATKAFSDALDALDSYRQRFETAPATLTNPILLGHAAGAARPDADAAQRRRHATSARPRRGRGRRGEAGRRAGRPTARRTGPPEPLFKIGLLPVARRDIDRLRQMLARAAPAAGHGGVAARQAGAAASRAVRGRADLARGPRPGTRDCRALARLHRGQLVRACRREPDATRAERRRRRR